MDAHTGEVNLKKSNLVAIVVPVCVVVVALVVVATVFFVRHRRLQRSFLAFANSHYNTRSGTTTFSSDLGQSLWLCWAKGMMVWGERDGGMVLVKGVGGMGEGTGGWCWSKGWGKARGDGVCQRRWGKAMGGMVFVKGDDGIGRWDGDWGMVFVKGDDGMGGKG